MSERDFHIAQNWRINAQRYALVGEVCSCGTHIFPPRPICPSCNHELEAKFSHEGTIIAVLNHPETKDQYIELVVGKNGKPGEEQRFNLNGQSHSFDFKVGMQVSVLARNSVKGEKAIYSLDFTSLSSK